MTYATDNEKRDNDAMMMNEKVDFLQ